MGTSLRYNMGEFYADSFSVLRYGVERSGEL